MKNQIRIEGIIKSTLQAMMTWRSLAMWRAFSSFRFLAPWFAIKTLSLSLSLRSLLHQFQLTRWCVVLFCICFSFRSVEQLSLDNGSWAHSWCIGLYNSPLYISPMGLGRHTFAFSFELSGWVPAGHVFALMINLDPRNGALGKVIESIEARPDNNNHINKERVQATWRSCTFL